MKQQCPAKINLFLEVTGKRKDGYHTLATLFAKINLYDVLEMALDQARPFTAKWSARELSYELTRLDSVFLVADEGGHVCGYALARVAEDSCLLLDFAAEEDGRGLGRAMMAELVAAAKARACAKITLEASAANARALTFYEKAGAKVVGRRPKFYYDGSDAVLMDIDL